MIPLQLRNFGKYGSSMITDRVAIECWLIRKNFFVLFLVNILLTVEPLIKFLKNYFLKIWCAIFAENWNKLQCFMLHLI